MDLDLKANEALDNVNNEETIENIKDSTNQEAPVLLSIIYATTLTMIVSAAKFSSPINGCGMLF